MNDWSSLAGVFVGWLLSCITQTFSYDALSRQTSLNLLVELSERIQFLGVKSEISTATLHEELLEIEKCLNKLRIAMFGFRFKNYDLKACVNVCCDRYKRYHMKRDCPSNKPHFFFVEIAQQWGFSLCPFIPSEKMLMFQEFMQLPAYKRAWIALKSFISNKCKSLQS